MLVHFKTRIAGFKRVIPGFMVYAEDLGRRNGYFCMRGAYYV